MKNAINEDLTFLYAYNIIERDHNPYDGDQKGNTINPKPETLVSSVEIEEECIKYKEDYPKNNLADFLLDADNMNFYLAQCRENPGDDELWLAAFNQAYELFDKIRVKAFAPFNAQYMVKNIYCADELLEQTIVKIVHNLLINYSYDLSHEQKIKFSLLTGKIEEYWDDNYYTIDDKYINDFATLNPDEVDWKKQRNISTTKSSTTALLTPHLMENSNCISSIVSKQCTSTRNMSILFFITMIFRFSSTGCVSSYRTIFSHTTIRPTNPPHRRIIMS